MDTHFWVSDLVTPSGLAGPASGEASGRRGPISLCEPRAPPPHSVSVVCHLFLCWVFPHLFGCLNWLNSGLTYFGKRHLSILFWPHAGCQCWQGTWCGQRSASGFVGMGLVLLSMSCWAASTGHRRCLWSTPVVLQLDYVRTAWKVLFLKLKKVFFFFF